MSDSEKSSKDVQKRIDQDIEENKDLYKALAGDSDDDSE